MKVNSSTMILCVIKHWTLQTFRFRLKTVYKTIDLHFYVEITLEEENASRLQTTSRQTIIRTVSTKNFSLITTHWTKITQLRAIEKTILQKITFLY